VKIGSQAGHPPIDGRLAVSATKGVSKEQSGIDVDKFQQIYYLPL
jgi:hypothetical protein